MPSSLYPDVCWSVAYTIDFVRDTCYREVSIKNWVITYFVLCNKRKKGTLSQIWFFFFFLDREDKDIKHAKLYENYLMFSVDISILKYFYLQMLIFKPLLTSKDCWMIICLKFALRRKLLYLFSKLWCFEDFLLDVSPKSVMTWFAPNFMQFL